MLKIAICDDENVIINEVEELLFDISRQHNIRMDIDAFYNGQELEKEILKGTRYDLIYMDIEMQDGDGITSAGNIRKVDENAMLIYISAYDKYVLELFRLNVFAFLKKPIEKEAFRKTFFEVHQKICNKLFFFTFTSNGQEHRIPCKDILYFESRGRKVNVYCLDDKVEEFYGKLSDVEDKLSKSKIPFLRIHQSYLVNFLLIRARSKSGVTLANGKRLAVSAGTQKKFARKYSDLLGGEIDAR